MLSKTATVFLGMGIAILSVFLILIAYSYSQIQLTLDNVSFAGIEWRQPSAGTFLNVVAGRYVEAGLSLIDGINLDLSYAASNNGFLPVSVPDLSYDLSINNINVGKGLHQGDVVLAPGQTKNIVVRQTVEKAGISSSAASIINNNGVIDLKASGTANFKILGLNIPVPFQATKQISIEDKIKDYLSANQPNGGSSESNQGVVPRAEPTTITVVSSTNYISDGSTVRFDGSLSTLDGRGLASMPIMLKSDTPLWTDPALASTRTGPDGRFTLQWTAQKPHWYSNTAHIYAVFAGTAGYGRAQSADLIVQVSQGSMPSNPSPSPNPSVLPYPPISASDQTIANSVYKVGPGKSLSVPFTLSCASNVRGTFSANAVLGDNIIVLISGQTQPSGYPASSSSVSSVYYNSGKVASGSFDLPMPTGAYYLVLSNTYSTFSTKTVTLQASSVCS